MSFLLAILPEPEPDVGCMCTDSFKIFKCIYIYINYALKLMILTKLGAERRRLVPSLVILMLQLDTLLQGIEL